MTSEAELYNEMKYSVNCSLKILGITKNKGASSGKVKRLLLSAAKVFYCSLPVLITKSFFFFIPCEHKHAFAACLSLNLFRFPSLAIVARFIGNKERAGGGRAVPYI